MFCYIYFWEDKKTDEKKKSSDNTKKNFQNLITNEQKRDVKHSQQNMETHTSTENPNVNTLVCI